MTTIHKNAYMHTYLNKKGTGAVVEINVRHPLFWIDQLRCRLGRLIQPAWMRGKPLIDGAE